MDDKEVRNLTEEELAAVSGGDAIEGKYYVMFLSMTDTSTQGLGTLGPYNTEHEARYSGESTCTALFADKSYVSFYYSIKLYTGGQFVLISEYNYSNV